MPDVSLQKPLIPGYEIRQRIGEGGMGEVYLANQLSLDRSVVVKFLKSVSSAQEADLKLRFDREATLMAEVVHPNIVTVFDRGTVDNRPYLVMEYVDGENLRDCLQPGKPMSIEQAGPILQSIARALTALHKQSILHRDLKPENVLLDQQGRVKISDFGVSVSTTEIGSVTQSGQFVGTIDYMAPEQRHQLGVDERADQFSLAVIAYELLTGHKPLGVFKRPSEQNRNLSPTVDTVILRGLQRDPDDRYATIEEFSAELDFALSGMSRRRWPRPLVLMLVLIVTAATLWFGFPEKIGYIESFWGTGQPINLNVSEQHSVSELPPPSLAVVPFTADEAKQHQQQWADHLQVSVVETNSIGMQMVLIPPGKFMMGSSEESIKDFLKNAPHKSASRRLSSEMPEHSVKLTRPFFLGTHEVTVEQFREFVLATQYETEAKQGKRAWGLINGQWQQGSQYSWDNLGNYELRDKLPVVNVSWNDASRFCQWLSQQEQIEYRLPSEAEWEYACRGGSDDLWFFGNKKRQLSKYAWFGLNLSNGPRQVGQKAPNPFGLYDVYGNVFEWCVDWYRLKFYEESAFENPVGSHSGMNHILRGEAIYGRTNLVRSASRMWHHSSVATQYVGFRVARSTGGDLSQTSSKGE